MNIKCNCGEIYSVPTPKMEANLDVAIYTDGVVEGGSVPRDIKVFKCNKCGEYKYLSLCERVEDSANTTISEPTSEEYLELIELEDFNSLGLRVKAWQKSNDRYRNLDSLEDVGVKIELLKSKIATIPEIAHFDEYITKMASKYEETKSDIILDKLNQLHEKKLEVLGRVVEKNYLEELKVKQTEMAKIGEVTINYTDTELNNMNYLLENLDTSGASLLIKSEIYRNLGKFDIAMEVAGEIEEKHYDNIKSLIIHLCKNKLKKTTQLREQ